MVLHWTMSKIRQGEAVMRRRLPSWAGGRFRVEQISHRVLGPKDAVEVAGLYNSAAAAKGLWSETSICVGLFRGGKLVAAGWVSPQWQFLGLPGQWLGGAHVDRRLRRRGLGEYLHRMRLAEAARRGIQTIHANVAAENTVNLRALNAVGFQTLHEPDWERLLAERLGKPQILLVISTAR